MQTMIGIVIAACCAGALAQAPVKAAPRVGVLHNGMPATTAHMTEAFVAGLAELGYTDGKNITLDIRYAEGQFSRLPALAQELANLNTAVLFAPSALASNAARKAGFAAPIVFALAPDPVGEGFATTLARPGGNMTGLTSLSPEVGAKRVEILQSMLPKASRLAALYATGYPGVATELAEIERALKQLGKEFLPVEAKAPEDFDKAFREMIKWRADAVLVIENPMFYANRKAIAGLAEKERLPAIYRTSDYVNAGGLISYGANYADLCRRAASYVDRILKGAKPGELPIEQPVKFELVINVKAAKAMGLAIPRDLLVRADQVLD